MNKAYLDKVRYPWDNDPRKLKVEHEGFMIIPDGRCMCCARILLNAERGIAYCRDCDMAMSCAKDGPNNDYGYCGNSVAVKGTVNKFVKLTARREIRTPIPFDEESKYFIKEDTTTPPPNFILGNGMKLTDEEANEAERIRKLYDLK